MIELYKENIIYIHKILSNAKVYLFFYIIRTILFFNHHSISHIFLCASFLIFFYYNDFHSEEIDINYFENNILILILILSSYLFYVIERTYFTYILSFKSHKLTLTVINSIVGIGLILLIQSFMIIKKYGISYEVIHRIVSKIKYGSGLVMLGNSYYIGKLFIDFLFYSVEKEFFIYRNEKYRRYIRVAQYTPYEKSKYAL